MRLLEAIQVAKEALQELGNLNLDGNKMFGVDERKAEAYNLLAKYHKEISELDKEESPCIGFPKYVFLQSKNGISLTALVHEGGDTYFRDAGRWRVNVTQKGNEFFVNSPNKFYIDNHLDGLRLVPCTKEEWEESNSGYI